MTHHLRIVGSIDGIARSISSQEMAEECGQASEELRGQGFGGATDERHDACGLALGNRSAANVSVAPRIPPDILEDLRWMAESPLAIVTMSKSTLRRLIAAYDEQVKHG